MSSSVDNQLVQRLVPWTTWLLLIVAGCKANPSSADDVARGVFGEAGCQVTRQQERRMEYACGNDLGAIDLGNLDRQLAGVDDEARRAVMTREFVRSLLPAANRRGEALPRKAILPILKARSDIEATMSRVPAELRQTHGILARPFAAELVSVLVVDSPGTLTLITEDRLGQWNVSVAELASLAMENLAAKAHARPERVSSNGSTWVRVQTGDACDAARLLLPAVRRDIEALLGGSAAYAVPTRDHLMAARADDGKAVRALRAEVKRLYRSQPHPLSDQLFQFEAPGGWRTVPEPL
jgi:uncharacterized protein YtpQ (UPF0354 family)